MRMIKDSHILCMVLIAVLVIGIVARYSVKDSFTDCPSYDPNSQECCNLGAKYPHCLFECNMSCNPDPGIP